MFNLIQDASQTSYAQEQQANASFQEYFPTSSALFQNFSQGTVVIPFALSAPNWWVPSKSFVRLLVNTSYPAGGPAQATEMTSGAPFLQIQGIAPAMFQAASLFSRIEFMINGVSVDLISDFTPQVHAFLERTLRPRYNLESAQYSRDFVEADFRARQSRVTLPSLNPLGLDNQTTRTYSIYEYNVVQPAAGSIKATVPNADHGTSIVLTSSAPQADNWATLVAAIRPGDIITILTENSGCVGVQAMIASARATSNTVCTFAVANISGFQPGVDASYGDTGYRTANVFISRVQERQINNTYELLWRPPNALFQYSGAIPSGSFCELRLTPWPASVYQARGVETLNPNLRAGVDFQVQVADLSLNLYTTAGPRIENLNWLLPLDFQVSCQAQAITVGANSLLQQNWDIPSSTYLICIALQNRALNNPDVSSTKFVVGTVAGQNQGLERSLTRLFIQFRGQSLPPQRQEMLYVPYDRSADPSKNPGTATSDTIGNDQFTLRYLETYLNNSLAFGSCERESEWLDRGPIYSFFVPADVSASTTRLQVNTQFSADLRATGNVLVFALSRRIATVSVEASRWTSISVQDL